MTEFSRIRAHSMPMKEEGGGDYISPFDFGTRYNSDPIPPFRNSTASPASDEVTPPTAPVLDTIPNYLKKWEPTSFPPKKE